MVILWIGVIVVAGMCFYPPTYYYKGNDRVNLENLIPYCTGVGLVTAALTVSFRTVSKKLGWSIIVAVLVIIFIVIMLIVYNTDVYREVHIGRYSRY